ncbi:hypothetical protein PhiS1_21 [Pseudomonas phage Phi-S1]|uniref:Uncharacterized protein n=1 Tax=Pseudomonas phage Phi-S1 TaxID=1204538 RepID=M4H4I7_9CAUD|nr:nucleotidyltransferase [Pseudomonas phage Phi-S1]AFO12310.1 hypothetical protein PhiS1_21 [Pseudomonas phage Phi-S1]
MSVNRANVQAAFDLVMTLRASGIQAGIAGGFARDIYFGKAPKDIDVVVTDCSWERLQEFIEETKMVAVPFRIYNEAKGDRLIGGFKCLNEIDIVLYDCRTLGDAIDNFDFNLNQFMVRELHLGIDHAIVQFVGEKHWSTLEPVRPDFTFERECKMREKFIDLTPRRATGELDEAPLEI